MKYQKLHILWLILTAFLIYATNVSGQAWQKNFFGDNNFADVVITPDGNFVATKAGSGCVFKVDTNGSLLWEHSLPSNYENILAQSVAVLQDGSIVAVGQTAISTPNYQQFLFVVKLDPTGTVIWEQFHPAGGGPFLITAIPGSSDFIIGGQYQTLVKVDQDGNIVWQNTNGGIRGLTGTPDGGALLLVNDNTTGSDLLFVKKVDNLGSTEWSQAYIGNGDLVGRQMTPTSDGGVAVAGFDYNGGDSDFFILKIQANGATGFFKHFNLSSTNVGRGITQTQDGGFLVTGWTLLAGRITCLLKLDDQGDVAWEQTYGSGEGMAVKELSDGSIVMAARGVRLYYLNADGTVFQNIIKGTIVEDTNADCTFQTGEPGLENWTVWADGDFRNFAKTNANGEYAIAVDTGSYTLTTNLPNFEWQPCQPTILTDLLNTPDTADVGEWMMEAVTATMVTISGYVYNDIDGDCIQGPNEPALENCQIWAADEPNWADGFPQYTTTSDATGYYSFTLPAGEYYGVVLADINNNPLCTPCGPEFFEYVTIPATYNIGLQCQGNSPQHVPGYVFYDENSNCQLDFGEDGISGWEIKIVEQGAIDTVLIDGDLFNNGVFNTTLDTGQYYFTITPPNYLFFPCQTTQVVEVTQNGTPPVMFPLMPFAQCPKMSVDIGTAVLRPCTASTYAVQYCNEGTETAIDAYVEISLPPDLVLDSSEIPGTSIANNVWSFYLGDVEPGECNNFWFSTTLDCDSQVGLTHCVEAHIYPDSICLDPMMTWDGSSINLVADCVGDSVVLTIMNNGWGDMASPLEFIVVEDNVLIKDSLFQLESGNSTEVVIYPNGATIVVQAQQSFGHPGNSFPTVFVEGCGGDSISIGFVTQYPQGDDDSFIAIDCRESVGSFDPNIKEAQPKGVTAANFITPETKIDYQITFQNLGTAPALEVVILDTLSQYLDTATLRVGASSHDYDWELIGENILKFTFADINLPHEAVDTAGSIGFVKYQIAQTVGNQPNTTIENRAGIYFDFNAPVITNTVTHRIPEPVMHSTQTVTICAGGLYNGQAYEMDTQLSDTVHYAFFDSVFITEIVVLPNSETQLSDEICEGEVYEFNGEILDTEGQYSALLFNQNGCDSLVLLDLVVHPDQSTSIDTLVAVGTEILGIPVFSDTTFVQELVDVNGCFYTLTTNVQLIVNSTEKQNDLSLSIAPNPNKGVFTIRGNIETAGHYSATLKNMLGQTVADLFNNKQLEGTISQEVSLPPIAPGIYFLSIENEAIKATLRVVILNP